MTRLFLLGLALISPYLFAQDDGIAIRLESKQQNYTTGRGVFSNVPIADLELRLISAEYAVIKAAAVRQALQVGDNLGKESYLVLSIGPKGVLLETDKGYAELLRDAGGRTRFRPMDRAFPAPAPKSLPGNGDQ